MNKTMLGMVLIMGLSGFAYANCGNDNGNGNGCSGEGTQGPAGPQGQPGIPGTNGLNGAQGQNGKNGSDANASAAIAQANETKLVADVAVRLYDGQFVQLQAFNAYALNTRQSADIFGDGHNMMYGMRLVVKLGKSYEERLLDQQAAQIKALEHILAKAVR